MAVAAFDARQGDYLGAALGLLFTGPALELAGKGMSFALKIGDEIVGHLPVGVLKRLEELAPEERAAIVGNLEKAATKDEALKRSVKCSQIRFSRMSWRAARPSRQQH